jgi:hypothetical protein
MGKLNKIKSADSASLLLGVVLPNETDIRYKSLENGENWLVDCFSDRRPTSC